MSHDTNRNSRNPNACTGRSTSTSLYSSNSLYFNQENLNPKTLIAKGMQAFQQGKIQESIQYFDQADSLVPNEKLSPYLWQRGISLYYANAFQEASHQFQLDVKVNPLDVEEIVWDIASQNRLYDSQGSILSSSPSSPSSSSSTSLSSPRYLSLPPGKTDRRKIMNVIYSLFRNENGVKEQDLMYAGNHGR
jgi:tetratricopeptide (TPR) repeat protein